MGHRPSDQYQSERNDQKAHDAKVRGNRAAIRDEDAEERGENGHAQVGCGKVEAVREVRSLGAAVDTSH